MVLAQGMIDAFFLLVQFVAILQRALGCPPQEAPVIVVEGHKTSLFLSLRYCNVFLRLHIHRTSGSHTFLKQVSTMQKAPCSRDIIW